MTNTDRNVRDYRLEIRVKNNRILERIKDLGFSSLAAFAKTNVLPYKQLVDLVALRDTPKTNDGYWRKFVVDLATALRVEPEELFSAQQLIGVPTPSVVRFVDEEDLVSLSSHEAMLMIEDPNMDRKRLISQIMSFVAETNLTNRQRILLVERYVNNKTYREIGDILGLSHQHCTHIEQAAFRKIRGRLRHKDKELYLHLCDIGV